jgi:hypothetical protein
VVGGVVTFLLLSLPPRLIPLIHDGASQTLLPDALLCVHAEFVERSLESKLPKMADSDPHKAATIQFLSVLHSEIDNAKHAHNVYQKLGFNADYLMHSDTLSAAIHEYTGNDREKFRAYCFSAYFDAVAHDPVRYVLKVCDQMGHFFFPEGKTFFHDTMNLKKPYQDSATSWFAPGIAPMRADIRELYGKYRQDTDRELASAGILEKWPRMRIVRELLARASLPLEISFLLVLVASLLWAPLQSLRTAGLGALALFSAPFSNAFGVCVVHTLDIYRYRVTFGGYLLFALTAMTIFLVAALIRAAMHLRSPDDGTTATHSQWRADSSSRESSSSIGSSSASS